MVTVFVDAYHILIPDVRLHMTNNCLKVVHTGCVGKAGSVSQCENLGGGQKLANRFEPFLDQSSPNLGAYMGFPVD